MEAKVAYYPTGEELRLSDCEADMDARRKTRERLAALVLRCNDLEQWAARAELLLAEETARRVKLEAEHEWLVRTMNRLALRMGPLDGEMEQIDEPTSI
jgi:hypothetical protein